MTVLYQMVIFPSFAVTFHSSVLAVTFPINCHCVLQRLSLSLLLHCHNRFKLVRETHGYLSVLSLDHIPIQHGGMHAPTLPVCNSLLLRRYDSCIFVVVVQGPAIVVARHFYKEFRKLSDVCRWRAQCQKCEHFHKITRMLYSVQTLNLLSFTQIQLRYGRVMVVFRV